MQYLYIPFIKTEVMTNLNDFHWINTFEWFLSDKTSDPSILHIQTRMLLTCQVQKIYKVLIHQNILFRLKKKRGEKSGLCEI